MYHFDGCQKSMRLTPRVSLVLGTDWQLRYTYQRILLQAVYSVHRAKVSRIWILPVSTKIGIGQSRHSINPATSSMNVQSYWESWLFEQKLVIRIVVGLNYRHVWYFSDCKLKKNQWIQGRFQIWRVTKFLNVKRPTTMGDAQWTKL